MIGRKLAVGTAVLILAVVLAGCAAPTSTVTVVYPWPATPTARPTATGLPTLPPGPTPAPTPAPTDPLPFGVSVASVTPNIPPTSLVGDGGGIVATPSGSPDGALTISLPDNGKTVHARVGQTILLFLNAADITWNVSIADESIVSPLTDLKLPPGMQAQFTAVKPGRTTLTANGSMVCNPPGSPCAALAMLFQVTIVVQPTQQDTAPGQLVLTMSDNGRTIALKVGQTFLVNLNPINMKWDIQIEDTTVVAPVRNMVVSLPEGMQGNYAALKPGSTTLTAVGTMSCPAGQACPALAMLFKVTLVVE